jgi:mRNA-degrading endonuclease RelE of RelBE toxin-antitoxin system
MTFEIRWDKKAVEFLRKLHKPASRRIVQKIDEIKSNPERYLAS